VAGPEKVVLHVGIEFHPRIPDEEFAVVVDLVEQRLRRSGDGEAAFDGELAGLKRGDDEDDGNNGGDAEEDFFDHGSGC
jgi:hypothetical protein